MNNIDSIGLIELTSVAAGYLSEDVMLKAAPVSLLLARTICSGKYLVAIAGDVASVQAAVEAGAIASGEALIDRRCIARLHPSIFPAVSNVVDLPAGRAGALGIVETFSAASIIEVADAAVKSANITLLRIHLAMALGGKGFLLLTGDVSNVQAAVDAGSRVAAEEGMLVGRVVIAAPSKELFQDYI